MIVTLSKAAVIKYAAALGYRYTPKVEHPERVWYGRCLCCGQGAEGTTAVLWHDGLPRGRDWYHLGCFPMWSIEL